MSDSTETAVTRRDLLRAAAGSAAAVGATGAAAAQEGGNQSGGNQSDGGGGGGGGGATHTVGMGTTSFEPAEITIAPGDTIVWENTSDVEHTVTAYGDEIPESANYFASGGFGSEEAARGDMSGGLLAPGDTYEHTFEVAGSYGYFCIPHEGAGMVGTVSAQEGGGGGEGGGSVLPDSAKTLGVTTVGAMVSVLALAYFFLKYGGDYGEIE